MSTYLRVLPAVLVAHGCGAASDAEPMIETAPPNAARSISEALDFLAARL
jgi:hypothetical protein